MSDNFDAVVIGAGPAGEVCAGELADGGMTVAIIERELVGGECGYWACIPSKTLLRPGEALAGARHAPGARQAVGDKLDVEQALGWRNYMVADWKDDGQLPWLESKGIELVRGDAVIGAAGLVTVGGRSLHAEQMVIATGSDPAVPPIPGLDKVDFWTNREATSVKQLPKRLLVLGGGPVGIEIAQAYARFGVSVAIVEGEQRLLPREGNRAGEAVKQVLEADSVEIHLGCLAQAVEPHGDGARLLLEGGIELTGDKLLVATGRRPRIDGLGLDSAGIEPGRGGIEVDEHLRAGDGVWAIGDVTGVSMFTHVGKYQARVAAADILGKQARADYRAIPHVTFSDPQVAGVGLTEQQAESAGLEIATATTELSSLARTSTYTREWDELPGFLTLIADASKQSLVGAYAVGPEAGEWIGQATLAVRAELPLDLLRDTIQPYPTFSEAFVSALQELEA